MQLSQIHHLCIPKFSPINHCGTRLKDITLDDTFELKFPFTYRESTHETRSTESLFCWALYALVPRNASELMPSISWGKASLSWRIWRRVFLKTTWMITLPTSWKWSPIVGYLEAYNSQMIWKTNLRDEPKTGHEDTSSVCGLSYLKTLSQMVLKTSLGTNPETVLEDALMVYACDILRTFPMSWRLVLKTLEEFRRLEDVHIYLLIDRQTPEYLLLCRVTLWVSWRLVFGTVCVQSGRCHESLCFDVLKTFFINCMGDPSWKSV